MSLNGAQIDPNRAYRVTLNAYLAAGGDGFTVFKDGAAPQTGVYDVDALFSYFKTHSPVAPPPTDRVTRLN